MHSSVLLLAALSAHALAIAIAKPYDPSVSWDELPGLEAFNYNLLPADYLAETPPVITPKPQHIKLPVVSPESTCGFPNRLACCTTNDYKGCHDASYTSFCSGKTLVCCSRVDITSQIGIGCGPLTPASPAVDSPPKPDTTKGGETQQEPITSDEKLTVPTQVPVPAPAPNAPDFAVPEGNKEESNPNRWENQEYQNSPEGGPEQE